MDPSWLIIIATCWLVLRLIVHGILWWEERVRWRECRTEEMWLRPTEAVQHPDWRIRVLAARRLARATSENAVKCLLRMAVQDPYRQPQTACYPVREAAQAALRALPTYWALKPLLRAVTERPLPEAVLAVQELGRRRAREATETLVWALSPNRPTPLRRAAAEALQKLGPETVLESLLAALADKDAQVREAASRALWPWARHVPREADRETVERLVRVLESEGEDRLRAAVALALGRCGGVEELKRLRRIAAQWLEPLAVRRAAIQALEMLEERLHLPPETALSRVRLVEPGPDERALSRVSQTAEQSEA